MENQFIGRIHSSRPIKEDKFANKDRRVTSCTKCELGIFTDHSYHWTSNGLIHVDCDNPRKEKCD